MLLGEAKQLRRQRRKRSHEPLTLHPYLRGYEVVVIAVLKNAPRIEEYDHLTTEEAVIAAGGVGPDDRLEVAPILPKEGLSFVTSDPRATDVEAFRSVARHGAGSKRRGKK